MILVLSGTKDGNEIISLLKKEGHNVIASAVTKYGGSLAREAGPDEVIVGALDQQDMIDLLEKNDITDVVDATHPFATQASNNAMRACEKQHIKYIRYERRSEELPDSPMIHRVRDFDEASKKAVEFGDTIFYTAGSRNLEKFIKTVKNNGKRLVVRVLPDPKIVKKCLALGIKPGDIIPMEGKNSFELNKRLFQEFEASVLVTKDSGKVGGTGDKIAAALDIEIPVILIERPEIEYKNMTQKYADILQLLTSKNG